MLILYTNRGIPRANNDCDVDEVVVAESADDGSTAPISSFLAENRS